MAGFPDKGGWIVMNTDKKLAVDQEWIDLIKAAHELGLKIEEVIPVSAQALEIEVLFI